MQIILAHILALILLFIILGVAADFAVRHIRYIASILRIPLFAFGILLGIITSLPELAVGINATASHTASLSVGNILGGTIVMLTLILGTSVFFNKRVPTNGSIRSILPMALVILLPLPLGLDGAYGALDGLLLISAYLGLLWYLYTSNHHFGVLHHEDIPRDRISRSMLLSIAGVIIVMISSHWVITIASSLLDHFAVSKILAGMVVFAVGTNLPEIMIAITAWRSKTSTLSLSHLLSSSFTNTMILGILATIAPITFGVGAPYIILSGFLILTIVLFLLFYGSKNRLDRQEGIILVLIYCAFLIASILAVVL